MLALGMTNILLLIQQMRWGGSFDSLAAIDGAGGLLAIAGGLGLMKPRRWGWALTMAAWGALVANAAVYCWMFRLVFTEGLGEGTVDLIPRLLFYPLVLLLSPYGVWATLCWKENDQRARKLLVICFVGAALVTLGAWALDYLSNLA